MTFETALSVAATGIKVGGKHTIDTTGSLITATTTDGVAEVVTFDGTAAGSRVVVRLK